MNFLTRVLLLKVGGGVEVLLWFTLMQIIYFGSDGF